MANLPPPPAPSRLVQLLERLGLNAADCARADGRYSIPIKEGRLDLLALTNKRLLLETVMAYLPPEAAPRRACFERALRFAATQMSVRADILSYAPEQGALVLQHELSLAMTLPEMEAALEYFLQAADLWRQALHQP